MPQHIVCAVAWPSSHATRCAGSGDPDIGVSYRGDELRRRSRSASFLRTVQRKHQHELGAVSGTSTRRTYGAAVSSSNASRSASQYQSSVPRLFGALNGRSGAEIMGSRFGRDRPQPLRSSRRSHSVTVSARRRARFAVAIGITRLGTDPSRRTCSPRPHASCSDNLRMSHAVALLRAARLANATKPFLARGGFKRERWAAGWSRCTACASCALRCRCSRRR